MRKSRKLNNETKKLISQKLKNRPKTESHKQALSMAMKNYWKSIPELLEEDQM